jgi:hypothetical protein
MCEELSLEDTIDQWIRFLRRANAQREPIILENRGTDILDRSERYGSFGLYGQLSVYHGLHHDVDVSVRLGPLRTLPHIVALEGCLPALAFEDQVYSIFQTS